MNIEELLKENCELKLFLLALLDNIKNKKEYRDLSNEIKKILKIKNEKQVIENLLKLFEED